MSGPSTPRSSRRAVLAACGTGLASLAGCSAVELGRDERTYDVGRLSDVAAAEVPTRPDAFPVEIAGDLLDRHYDRARELLSTVPERPEVPNDVVERRLREDRTRVVDSLEGGRDDADPGPERLSDARYVRESAAEVDGVYRAVTREVDRETVAEREGTLRADLRSFEAAWDYRGDTPARALVVHAELEDLRGDARRDAKAWPSIPADPATDPFRVGERIGKLESGRAALDDADRLRTAYLEGADDPRSFRATITAAAHRLEDRSRWDRPWAHRYLDTRPGDLPFDRDLEDTPAARLFHEARRYASATVENARRTRRAGDHATAVLAGGVGLASLGTFAAVVDAIENGMYGPPDDVEAVATAREQAVAAVEAALETTPVPVSVEVIYPATDALHNGRDDLGRADGRGRGVDQAFALFVFARRYAEEVPAAVATVVDALREGR